MHTDGMCIQAYHYVWTGFVVRWGWQLHVFLLSSIPSTATPMPWPHAHFPRPTQPGRIFTLALDCFRLRLLCSSSNNTHDGPFTPHDRCRTAPGRISRVACGLLLLLSNAGQEGLAAHYLQVDSSVRTVLVHHNHNIHHLT